MKQQELIKLGHRLIIVCNRNTPQLIEVEKLTGVKYEEIHWSKTKYVGTKVSPDASNHLKATALAVAFFDGQVYELYKNVPKNLDPQDPSNTFEDTKVIALQVVLHNLHIFQKAHEKEVLKKHEFTVTH